MRKSPSIVRIAAHCLLVGSALTALTSTRVANAQGKHEDRVQYEVFEDDLLNADVGSAFDVQCFPQIRAKRVLLIRPRTNFLPELYKSVEHL